MTVFSKRSFAISWGLVASCSVWLAGCPSPNNANDAAPDTARDSAVPDAIVDDVAIMDVATDSGPGDTGTDATTDGGTGCTPTRVLVALSDYGAAGTSQRAGGSYSMGNLDGTGFAAVTLPTSPTVHADHFVRTANCRVFDLWRTFPVQPNFLVELGSLPTVNFVRTLTFPALGGDGGMASAANPSDIVAVSSSKAYVPLYNTPEIAIVDLQTFQRTGTIDLRSFAMGMSDMNTESIAMTVVGNRAYLAIQLLDNFMAPAQSAIVVLDTTTDMPVDLDTARPGLQATIATASNPPGPLHVSPDGNSLVMVGTGDFGQPDGKITVIDLPTHTVRHTLGAAQFLNREPVGVVILDAQMAWVALGGTTDDMIPLNYLNGTIGAQRIPVTDGTIGLMKRAPNGQIWALGTRNNTTDAGTASVPVLRVFSNPQGTLTNTIVLGGANLSGANFDFVP